MNEGLGGCIGKRSFALAPHGTSLLDGWVARQLLVFLTFHWYECNLSFVIEVQTPAIRLGQWGRSHTSHGLGEEGRPELAPFGLETCRRDAGSLDVNRELNFFLGELVGLRSDELIFDLRDGSLALAFRRNRAHLRFGVGGDSNKRVDVVHDLPEDAQQLI